MHRSALRRTVWFAVLLASLAAAGKLALKPYRPFKSASDLANSPAESLQLNQSIPTDQPNDSELLVRYAERHELVEKLLASFGHNARRIESTDGIRGLCLLGELGDAGVCLYEERPEEFHRLSLLAGNSDTAQLIGAWGRFFDPAQSDREVTAKLAVELSRLPAPARRLAEQTPEALPFLLADTRGVSGLLERLGPAALESLAYVDLSDRGNSLRHAIAILDRHGSLAINATEELGPAGFLLIERFGPLVELLHRELGLRRSLAVVASALDDLDQLLEQNRTRTIGDAILHLDSRGLLDMAAGTPDALKLVVEFGPQGEHALEVAGPHVAGVIYKMYPAGRCRNAVVQAIDQGGLPAAAAAEKHGNSEEFRRIVTRDGPAAVLAVASACSSEEARQFLAAKTTRTWTESLALAALRLAGDSGENTIRMIDRDGLERAESLANPSVQAYQFLPLYDLSHLGGVVSHGYAPTRGEFVWAGVDATLVAVDVLSMLSLQPEGVAAGETARSTVKSAATATVRSSSREAVKDVTEGIAESAARTSARQLALEASSQLSQRTAASSSRNAETAGAELAESLARKSSMRLVYWPSAATGRSIVNRLVTLPQHRLAKYVAANAAQAGVGLVAVRKMEEYLEGRGVLNKDRGIAEVRKSTVGNSDNSE